MTNPQFRTWLIVVLIVAAAMRAGFLLFGPVLPVVWDQRIYAGAALGIISHVDDSGTWEAQNEQDDRDRFRHYYEKYIDGEDIEYLAYTPPTLTQARSDLYLSGPLFPTVLAGVIYLSPWEDFTIARVLGIILDLLALLLLLQIGRRLVGTTPSVIAGFMYAVYFPFIFTSATILLETSTTFLTFLAIYQLLRSVEDDSVGRLIAGGIVTGLLILNKPTAMLLAVPLAVAFFVHARRRWEGSLVVKRTALYLLPVGIIFAGWIVVVSSHFGQLTLRDPSYADANLRHATSIINEGYGLDAVDEDFWERNVWSDLASDMPGAAGLMVKKLDRLWSQPYNDFDYRFIIPQTMIGWLHTVFVFFGIIGVVVWLARDFPAGLWLAILPLYYTGIHVIFHAVSRYVFTAVPMVMLAAAVVIAGLISHLASADRNRRSTMTAVALLLLGALLRSEWFTVPLGIATAEWMVVAVLLIRSVLLMGGSYILVRQLFDTASAARGGRLVPIAVVVLVVPTLFVSSLARDAWGEFGARLSESTVKAGTRIYMSNPPEVRGQERLVAAIDMLSGRERSNTFTAYLPDYNRQLILGKGELRDYFYVKPTYKHYGWLQNRRIEQVPQYAFIFLDADSTVTAIRRNGYIDIAVAINEQTEEPENWVQLFGSHAYSSDSGWIPAMRRTSVERYVDRDDPRVRVPVEFLSDSAISYYIGRTDQEIPRSSDLSPSPGVQHGRYNMFLVHFYPDGRWQVY